MREYDETDYEMSDDMTDDQELAAVPDELKLWERQAYDTDKSWRAFEYYRDMPASHADRSKRRSITNAARDMGYTDDNQFEKWSYQKNWQMRVRAYDAYRAATALTLRESKMADFIVTGIEKVTTQLAAYDRIVDNMLRKLTEAQALDYGEGVSPLEIMRAGKAIEVGDVIRRRIAGLPTGFRTQDAPNDTPEEAVFMVGVVEDE